MVNETLFNTSSTIGAAIVSYGDTTGSLFLTLLVIVIALVLIALAAGLPVEVTAILVFPLILASWSVSGDFVAVGGVTAIYLGVVFARNFPLK